MKHTALIHRGTQQKMVWFEAPMRLADVLRLAEEEIEQPCGGRGHCGKCRVRVQGAVESPGETEKNRLDEKDLRCGVRLACLAVASGDVEIRMDAGKKESILTNFALPVLHGEPWGQGTGLAVDIGTTTIAAYLYDLTTRETLCVGTRPNPQRAFGADVISRIQFSLEGGGEELRRQITTVLGEMTEELLRRAGLSENAMNCAVITGNTAMLYLLMGRETNSIAFAPFEPATRFGVFTTGEQVGLDPSVRVWLPECVAAYVGADITCAMLYAGFYGAGEIRVDAPVLLADIGTNGEMALAAHGKLWACSTAAGPAFEGAGICCGMTAQEGAIHRVDRTEDGLTWAVIGDGCARGICGSGLVDAIAALVDAEVVDETGRLRMSGHAFESCMLTRDGQPAFRFSETDVVLTQADIRAVQLAKAAICAGMLVLLEEALLKPEDLHELLIAGGFGSTIRPESAERAGLIPDGLARRTRAVGNAAGAGATMMLFSDVCRLQGSGLQKVCKTVELSSNPAFSEYYIDCMCFE